LSAYTNHGKTTSSEEVPWAKINTEKDYFEKSQNYCSTVNRTAELNIHHEDPVSTKTV
jgi:hypothetical protein